MMTAVQPYKTEVLPDLCGVWVHFEHLSYSDFGRSETLEAWKLARMFESARFFGITTGIMDFRNNINRKFGYFVFGNHYKINPQLWNVRRGTSFPHKISLELKDVGTTSATFLSRIVNKLDGQVLGECLSKLVYVDRATRRPALQPEATLARFVPLVKDRRKMDLPRSPPEIPVSAFANEVTVAPSDTDFNGHTNHSSYIRYCSDAAQLALTTGSLRGFKTDVARYPLLEMEVVYKGESNTGDNLQVYVLQDTDRLDYLSFLIKKHQKDSDSAICHCRMTYGLQPLTPVSQL